MIGAAFPRRKRLTLPGASVPRVDWTNPLTRGLTQLVISAGHGIPLTLVGLQGTVGTNGSIESTPAGIGIYGASANVTVAAGNPIFPAASTPYTVAFVCCVRNLGVTSVLTPFAVPAPGFGYYFTTHYEGGPGFNERWQFTVGSTPVADGPNGSVALGLNAVLFTFDGNTAGNLYANGALLTSATGNFSPAATGGINEYQFGQTDGTMFVDGLIGAVWNKTALSANQALAFTRDPFSFLIFPEDEIKIVLASIITGVPSSKPRSFAMIL